MMPEKNYWFNEINDDTPVYLEGKTNQYYVAVINGERGVVGMDGQHQKEQQAHLDKLVRDTTMRDKGYRYLLKPTKKEFAPLYVKTLQDCGITMREYPKTKFDVEKI